MLSSRPVMILILGAALLWAITLDHDVKAHQNAPSKTQIVILGTGAPNADPDRSGPSVAIVVNDTPYIVDFGPGVVRRAAAAFQKGGETGGGPNTQKHPF